MAKEETLKHFDRIDINFRRSLIEEILPEYFREDYPNLVAFLEGYYEFQDSDTNFDGMIHELNTIRETEDASLERLDQLFHTLALGVAGGNFTFPREAIRNFGNFFRVKGSLFSGEGFFRGFFDEEVEIIYPKKFLFNVGESELGAEYGKFIQDGGKYQIFSILIKSPLSIGVWEQLWRRFVHPTGFYLANEVAIEGTDTINIITDESVPDPFKNIFFVVDSADAISSINPPQAQGDISHLNNYAPHGAKSNFGAKFHMNEPQFRTSPYRLTGYWADSAMAVPVGGKQYASINDVMLLYKDLKEWADFGITFDNLDSAGVGIRYDNAFETFDMRDYPTYEADYISPQNYVAIGYLTSNKQY